MEMSKVNTGNRRTRRGRQVTRTVMTPAAKAVEVIPRPPVVTTLGNRTRIVGHEQILTVNGSVGFVSTKVQVNPGLGLYTWLSQRARGWEKYCFEKYEVMYIPAEANTTTPGSVYIAADYDPTDSAPATLQALSTYEHQANGRVYNAVKLDLSPKRMFDGVQTKYVREGPVAGDLSLYDAASFTFATISCNNSDPIGQLWVRYVVDLISPQVESSPNIPTTLSFFRQSELADQTIATSGVTNLLWTSEVTNGLGINYNTTSGIFTLPKASYLISADLTLEYGGSGITRIIQEVDGLEYDVSEIAAVGAGSANTSFTSFITSNGSTTYRVSGTVAGADDTILIAAGTNLSFRVV